jgi:hypothetical protein
MVNGIFKQPDFRAQEMQKMEQPASGGRHWPGNSLKMNAVLA